MTDPATLAIVIVAGVFLGAPLVRALPFALRALGFERANFQGRPIGTAAGLLFLVVGAAWLFVGPKPDRLVAAGVAGFGMLGLADDRWGTPEFKGLRGHLRAFRSGRLTTGLIKAVGGAVLSGCLGWQIRPGLTAVPCALLIALCANFLNLLDLRPLRTLKAFWLIALTQIWAGPLLLAGLFGLSLPYSRLEARRSVMLGDVGSNALGAAIGVSAAMNWHPLAALLAVGALLLFHLWAEKHSLSAWIESHSWAKRLDGIGWRDDPG